MIFDKKTLHYFQLLFNQILSLFILNCCFKTQTERSENAEINISSIFNQNYSGGLIWIYIED